MATSLRLATMLLGVFLAAATTQAESPLDLGVTLGPIPALRFATRPPLTAAQVQRIKDLIAGLAKLDKPDFGLSMSMSGDAFAPVPGQTHARVFALIDHGLSPNEGMKALVALGPDAIPYLLDALADQTPTRIVATHDGDFGRMWHGSELPVNPVNPAESAVFKARMDKPRGALDGARGKSHTLKVGDVCFVALGQIVGRGYRAMRYQPTACVVLNCPAHDAELRAQVQAIWKSPDPRAKLFDSLLADYATQGVFNGRSLDGWSRGGSFQCGAALRLMYYFPEEASALVAGRLDALDVGNDQDLAAHMRRCVANGARSKDFIGSVAWSKNPVVRAAVTRVFERAGDEEDLLAALPGVDDGDLVRRRLEALIAALPAYELGPYGRGFHLLTAMAEKAPNTAQPVFEGYLRNAGPERCHTACLVLRKTKVAWDVAVLGPLLADTRTWRPTYAVVPGQAYPRLPVRVCDEAAITLSQNHPELKFLQAGPHAELDKQIQAMRERLDRRK